MNVLLTDQYVVTVKLRLCGDADADQLQMWSHNSPKMMHTKDEGRSIGVRRARESRLDLMQVPQVKRVLLKFGV